MPTDRETSRRILIAALEQLMSAGAEEMESIMNTLPSDLHADAVDVISNVLHFVADSDIRERDDGYRQMQETQMHRLIDALRRGEDRGELLKYDFLSG